MREGYTTSKRKIYQLTKSHAQATLTHIYRVFPISTECIYLDQALAQPLQAMERTLLHCHSSHYTSPYQLHPLDQQLLANMDSKTGST